MHVRHSGARRIKNKVFRDGAINEMLRKLPLELDYFKLAAGKVSANGKAYATCRKVYQKRVLLTRHQTYNV